MTAALIAFCAVLGLVVGSFLNVVIWRVPRGESIVAPRSHCPSCGHALGAFDNVPLVSWLLLRGRCRHCRGTIRGRYPAVEALTAAVFTLLAIRLGIEWVLPAFLYVSAVGVALAVIDLDVKRLPNVLTLPSYVVGICLLTIAALTGDGFHPLLRALLGMAALFTLYFALAFLYPAGMGFGDVKLAGVLGLYLGWLGWATWVVGAFAGFLLGGIVGIGLILTGRGGRKTAIPFGPFMLAGALLAVLIGNGIAHAYLRLTTG